LSAQPNSGRPTQGEASGEEVCCQPQGPPRPRACDTRQSFSKDVARACGMTPEELPDPELPCHPVATPREIGERPGVMTMDISGGEITPRASGVRLCRRDQEDDLGLGFIDAPGSELKRDGLRQQMGQRVSTLLRC
jgi:hypothetical protein